ncbi:amino acid permease [Enterobacteriaceae endosymbiont of Plateumaris consimilis]|uniref:basic amino acid/polyamine antiporter n=1 Tax=Enterobacteriaceae endosymbiont of Plateumaris consimilis TaxID=2675794 RepID=UPI0014492AD6|nr:basic amino acid/polyamine antiporter [Enterobacteriaceae endosymbiont of Plateumaris consimilis]QJC28803.1 amino acid permease [Enterobacteriaceae endosymbiont of Plateumaris consimilis]
MDKKLDLKSLTALVISSMLGAGVFSLPQNMAAIASPAALIIGWIITGIGITFLAVSMLLLHKLKPNLDGGIFAYAKDGFGELIGFCSAWGYWLCAVIANVSYLVIVFSAISFFTDHSDFIIFGSGNTWISLLAASILLWAIHFLLLNGTQTAAIINIIATLGKLLPLSIFIFLSILAFNLKKFNIDFTGIKFGVPIWEQVKHTMLITLWVFIGVEGAVILSSKAKNKKDISKATLLAVFIALCIYLLVTLLSLGIINRIDLANMRNPSMAGLMTVLIGNWGNIVIVLGLIISVCGAYLSWAIMAAEVPCIASKHGIFPKCFSKQNINKAPSFSLWFTSSSMQLCLILIFLTKSNYNNLLVLSSEMILIPYFLVGAYLLKISLYNKNILHIFIGMGSCIYGIWLLYASGPLHLLLSLILYAPGLIFLIIFKKYNPKFLLFNNKEKFIFSCLLLGSIFSLFYLIK